MGACVSVKIQKTSAVDYVMKFAVSPSSVYRDIIYDFDFAYTFVRRQGRPNITSFTQFIRVICALTECFRNDRVVRSVIRIFLTDSDVEYEPNAAAFDFLFDSSLTYERVIVILHVLCCMNLATSHNGRIEHFVDVILKRLVSTRRTVFDWSIIETVLSSFVETEKTVVADFCSVRRNYHPNFLYSCWEKNIIAILLLLNARVFDSAFSYATRWLSNFMYLTTDMWNMLFVLHGHTIRCVDEILFASDCFRTRTLVDVSEFWGENMKESIVNIPDDRTRTDVLFAVEKIWKWVVEVYVHSDTTFSSTGFMSFRRFGQLNSLTTEKMQHFTNAIVELEKESLRSKQNE